MTEKSAQDRVPEHRCVRCNQLVPMVRSECICHGLLLCDADWQGVHGTSSRLVTVPYRVPVNAVIDLENGCVVTVTVIDEQVERDEDLGVRDEDWNEVADADICEKALTIAEDEAWPAWGFGN